MALPKHFHQLLDEQWDFLNEEWPRVKPSTNHRTAKKDVEHLSKIKEVLYNRLGAIPVYFFLTTLWPNCKYPGPYKEVDKGLVLLFHLVKGLSMEAMSPFLPKSSFHAIHTVFYKKEYNAHNKYVSLCLATMFSNITIRLLSAKEKNPPLFKHVTLHLDGHDTRATYQGESSAEMYSYKLKKSGLRTQVAMDCNGMALWVSKSMPCKSFADGTMLLAMKIEKKVDALDCIAVDGGYTQYLKKLVEESDTLSLQNFAHPYRKKKHQELAEEESQYNSTFGSFRSQMESLFGELGATFERHNNRAPVLVEKKQTYNLQLKLALLLLNIKKMVALLKIPVEPIHTAWLREGFEYPAKSGEVEQPMDYFPLGALLEDGNALAKLQEAFLNLAMSDEDTSMEPPQQRSNITIEIPPRKNKRKANVTTEQVEDDDDDDDL
jgi:hypothetical protein